MKAKNIILKYRLQLSLFIFFIGVMLQFVDIGLVFLGFVGFLIIMATTEIYLKINVFKFEFYNKSTGELIESKTITGLKAYHYSKYMDFSARPILENDENLKGAIK